jgi:hypothetical protein
MPATTPGAARSASCVRSPTICAHSSFAGAGCRTATKRRKDSGQLAPKVTTQRARACPGKAILGRVAGHTDASWRHAAGNTRKRDSAVPVELAGAYDYGVATDNEFEAFQRGLARSSELAHRAADWHESNRRQIEAVVRAVREPAERVAAWVDANRDQINAFLAGIEALDRRSCEIEEEWKYAGLGYLVAPLGAAEQLFLSLHAASGPEELFDFLEAALANSTFVDETCASLDQAAVLSEIPRAHLQHGLRHLKVGEVLHAWPPLIIGLEGAFVDVAIDRGVAVRVGNHVHLADDDGHPSRHKVASVEGVAAKLGHNQDDFGQFLLRQVYGGDGNPFRHGVAQAGVRDRVVCLAIAVMGWLDAFVAPGSQELLRRVVVGELARRDDEGDASALRSS